MHILLILHICKIFNILFRYSEFLYFYDADDEGVLKNETISISLDASDPLLDMFIKRAVSDAIDDVIGIVFTGSGCVKGIMSSFQRGRPKSTNGRVDSPDKQCFTHN